MGLSSLRRHYLGSPTPPTPAAPRSFSAADHDALIVEERTKLRQERDQEIQKLSAAHAEETAKLCARIAELEAELAMVSARASPPETDEPKDDEPKHEERHEEKHEPARHRRGR